MQRRVSYHDVAWNRRTQQGALRLTFDDRTHADLRGLSQEELSLLCNMLRAEKPLYYDETSETLTTDASYSA
ncbi:MAG: hypothetical protein AAF430_12680 [Myxococcota bacterium]